MIWLSLWDMTRDGELAATDFIDTTLKMLGTETESTTFRYALAMLSTTVWHYTDAKQRNRIAKHVASELFALAKQAKAGSDEQFQLVSAYLTYGVEGDSEFADTVRGLLSGSLVFEGLELDNNFRWSIMHALASINAIKQADIDAELKRRDTTENREFAVGTRASLHSKESKDWAFDQALHNDELTNSQLGEVARGFSGTHDADLADGYVDAYFEAIDWIWKNKTFHMSEVLIGDLYPAYADPAKLVEAGDRWLAAHQDADNALLRMVKANVEASHRTRMVSDFNASIGESAR